MAAGLFKGNYDARNSPLRAGLKMGPVSVRSEPLQTLNPTLGCYVALQLSLDLTLISH